MRLLKLDKSDDYVLLENSNESKLLAFKGSASDWKMLDDWLSTLKLSSGKAPRGMKKQGENLSLLLKNLNLQKEYGKTFGLNNTIAVFSHWNENDIKEINQKFAKKSDEQDEIKVNGVLYENRSTMSHKNFESKIKTIDSFLKKLTGIYKKTTKDLHIVFVKKSESKATAKYKTNEDIVLMRPDRVVGGEVYGSAVYVLLHELGHRYEQKNKLPDTFTDNKWTTTKYSRTDSFSLSEKFAELFALSFWESKYPEYSEQIEEFKGLMKIR